MQLGLIFTQTSKFMYDTLEVEGQEERKESVLKVAKRERNVLLQSSHNSQNSQKSYDSQNSQSSQKLLAILAIWHFWLF